MFLLGLFCVVVGVVVVFVKHKKMCAETNSTDIEKNMWIREIALHTRKYRVTTCMTCNDIFSFISSRFWLDFCSNLTPRHTHTHTRTHTPHQSPHQSSWDIIYFSDSPVHNHPFPPSPYHFCNVFHFQSDKSSLPNTVIDVTHRKGIQGDEVFPKEKHRSVHILQ